MDWIPFGRWVFVNCTMSLLLGLMFAFWSNAQVRDEVVSIFVPRPVRFVTSEGHPTSAIDVGEVKSSSVFSAEVEVRNFSNRSVRIIGHKQSCKCARVISCPTVLDPKCSATAVVEFDSPESNGDQSVLFTLYLDEANQPQLGGLLKFRVIPGI
ncbi:MAG: DUF1573 domain-containing protein [Pirellula sp.]